MTLRRLVQLYLGLLVCGLATALMIRSRLGLIPWDALHQGLDDRTHLSFGSVVILTGTIVLAMWIPLRQRPGLGTISNLILIGLAADLALWLIPAAEAAPQRAVMLVGGIFLLGAGTSAYIGAGLGPGPRDGLMTGLAARTGWPISVVRTGIELSVLSVGWWLGGTVGLGTVLYTLAIGPIIQLTLPLFTIPPRTESERQSRSRAP
jgi:uncharacterized membrane protein YczE